MLLYHTGFDEIKHPDIHIGRKNADFGGSSGVMVGKTPHNPSKYTDYALRTFRLGSRILKSEHTR